MKRGISRVRSTLVLALVVLVGIACGGGDDPTDPEDQNGDGNGQASEVVEVELVNYAFNASTVTIEVGTTVRWRNTTGIFHTVTPDGHSAWQEWQTNGQGETFEVTFDEAGTYPYFCDPHRDLGMTGTVVVE